MEIEKRTVTLGTKQYELAALPFVRSRPWKKKYTERIKPLFDEMLQVADMDIETAQDLLKVVPILEKLLRGDIIEDIFELILIYSSELEVDRAYIESTATEKQILEAFYVQLDMVDPFGMADRLRRMSGRSQRAVLSNSRSRNGGSPRTKRRSSARKKVSG